MQCQYRFAFFSDSAIEDVPSVGNDTSKEVDYASFLALMDELEKKEALAEKNGDDSDQSEKTTDGFDDSPYQRPVDNNPQNIEVIFLINLLFLISKHCL